MNKTPPVVVKIDKSTIETIMDILIEANRNLAAAITEEMKIANENLTLKIIDDLKKDKREKQRLFNLKEIAYLIGINYRTLKNYKLPYQTIGNGSRKMYNIDEVKEYLQR